jgi:prophage regulatory protein
MADFRPGEKQGAYVYLGHYQQHGEVMTMKPDNDNPSRLMAPKEAAAETSLSRTLLTLLADAGQFPKPVKLGERRVAYVRSEIEAWINERIAGRAA